MFDVGAILACSPLIVPLLAVIALTLWVSSSEPVLYRQRRLGKNGKLFVILKFRTMRGSGEESIAAMARDRVTRIGRFLRWSKLDELPQVLNVLRGDMSLVGPRPKVPQQDGAPMLCRPGLTGAATLVFAREESLLARIPAENLVIYYEQEVLPAKRSLDAAYMARATFFSDLRILAATALGLWMAADPQEPAEPRHEAVPCNLPGGPY